MEKKKRNHFGSALRIKVELERKEEENSNPSVIKRRIRERKESLRKDALKIARFKAKHQKKSLNQEIVDELLRKQRLETVAKVERFKVKRRRS